MLARQGAAQPNFMIAVVTGDERNHFLNFQSLASLEVTLQIMGELWLKDDAQLLAETG